MKTDFKGKKEYKPKDKENDKRRSFNPNFSEDNKPLFEKKEKPAPWFKDKGRDDKPKFSKSNDKKDHKKSYPSYDSNVKEPVRLNRFISMSGVCSRREADELIKDGRITVNGQVVTELGAKVNPNDDVTCDGKVIRGEKKVYIVMNKPKGFVTTVEDPHADRTVIDLLGDNVKERVYPVGRLDKGTLGILLITNDGELTTQLTHPKYEKRKIYHVTLDKSMSSNDIIKILEGFELEDGFISADKIDYVGESKKEVGIELHSGRNRIVRRIFEALGYNVVKLDRVYFAGLTKKNLRRGSWRFLSDKEVSILKSGRYE